MNTTQQILDLAPRPKLRLSEIERLIRFHRIIVPPLSRRKLVALCEDGTLDHAPQRNARANYLVYEDSFLKWIAALDNVQQVGHQAAVCSSQAPTNRLIGAKLGL